jgi:hypothetical protein
MVFHGRPMNRRYVNHESQQVLCSFLFF